MKYWSHIQLEGKYSLDSTDPRESEIPPAAAGSGHRRWQRRGPAPAGQAVALRAAGQVVAYGHAPPSASLCEKHLLIYDMHMYQCIDIHWRFFL